MYIPLDDMMKATALTRGGRLGEAIQLIQRALAGVEPAGAEPSLSPGAPDDVTDVPFRERERTAALPPTAVVQEQQGAFTQHEHLSDGQRYSYRLYTPAGAAPGETDPRPVLVMLHGCKQDAADFARGTAMNELARQQGFLVVYPQQLASGNTMGCWNWFEPAHQQRGRGEPEMIATLARRIVAGHGGDPERVYIAGLSAGGAMATLVGSLYPDVFAAVGVHSGLAPGSANDVVSAFAAMRKGRAATAQGRTMALPTIVFHGSADKTVHPGNGRQIVQALLAADALSRTTGSAKETTQEDGRRVAARTVYKAPDGSVWLEHWEIASGPHAWSGGRPEGSFTDPAGPDASAALVKFLMQHRRPVQAAPIKRP